MRRQILIALLAGLSCYIAAQTIDVAYVNMPADLSPLLSPRQRYELMEYAKAGIPDTTTNFAEGRSWVEYANWNEQQICVRQTAQSTLELTLRGDTIVVISTLYAPLGYSTIALYDSHWRHIADIRPTLSAYDFLTEQNEEAAALLPPRFVVATLLGDSLRFENQTIDELFETDRERFAPIVRPYYYPL